MQKIFAFNLIALFCLNACGQGETSSSNSIEIQEESINETPPASLARRSSHQKPAFPIESVTFQEGQPRESSAVLIAKLGDRRIVFIADQDEQCVTAADPQRRTELASLHLEGEPSQMLLGHDGRLYVALRNKNQIISLEWTGQLDGSLRKSSLPPIHTEAEPIALALPPHSATLLSISGWGSHLEGFSIQYDENGPAATQILSIPLPREPRALLLSQDGKTAFVSHMTGAVLSAVHLDRQSYPIERIPLEGGDLDTPPMCPPPGFVFQPETKRLATQGYALARDERGRVFSPLSLARVDNPRLRSDGYGISSKLPSHIFGIAVLQGSSTPQATYASLHPQAETVHHHLKQVRNCLLPRAAHYDAARRSIFIACADIPTVLEVSADSPDPARALKQRYRVALGATALALDSSEDQAFVWSQFSRTLTLLPLGKASSAMAANRLKSSPIVGHSIRLRQSDAEDYQKTMGRMLFHISGDKRIAADGRACASCHPDGRDDGFTWATPDGPRQPPMLAGRVEGTAPYSWSNLHPTLNDHLSQTISRLHGKGLPAQDTEALVHYVQTMPGPPVKPAPERDALIARGKELFNAQETGCTHCHREESAFTDGALHDISSAAFADKTSLFETPSLRFIGGTAPYFHDGRYSSLRDLLLATKNTMGTTSHLSELDFIALESYLISLH